MSTVLKDNYQEDVSGRSNAADTPERLAYYAELKKFNAEPLWRVANKIEPWEPHSTSIPMLWRYADLRDRVLRSADVVTPEEAGRRAIYLSNPGREDVAAAVGWIYAALQTLRAGEAASAHWHQATAVRFIIEGRGAYTIVDGHKTTLGPNDFVITPNGTYHEHGVSEDGTQCLWEDALDIPLMNALDANFFHVHPDLHQAVTYPLEDTVLTWAAGTGLVPANDTWNRPYSPLFKYEWAPTYEALQNYAKITDGSPFDGVMMRYINPKTGEHPMRTMGASMQLLRPGERTKAHRHTGSFLYHVAKGSGYSIVNGERLDWKEHDIFCVPSWMFHEHANASDREDACLFCINDLPVMESLGLYREEALAENGGHQQA